MSQIVVTPPCLVGITSRCETNLGFICSSRRCDIIPGLVCTSPAIICITRPKLGPLLACQVVVAQPLSEVERECWSGCDPGTPTQHAKTNVFCMLQLSADAPDKPCKMHCFGYARGCVVHSMHNQMYFVNNTVHVCTPRLLV